MIERLHQECDQGNKNLNIEAWFNWTTFDVVGSLVFGQSFKCLENANYHPWIDFIFKSVRGGAVITAMTYLGLGDIVQVLYKLGSFAITTVKAFTDEMLQARLSLEKPQNDLFEGLVEKRDAWVGVLNLRNTNSKERF